MREREVGSKVGGEFCWQIGCKIVPMNANFWCAIWAMGYKNIFAKSKKGH